MKIGENSISDLYMGIKPVDAIYIGDDLFFTRPLLIETLFEHSTVNSTKPDWVTSSTRGFTVYGDSIFVVKNDDPISILAIDRISGEQTGNLNIEGVSGGFRALNDIETTEDGFIFGSNFIFAEQSPFKVYQFSVDSEISPTLVINLDVSSYGNIRLGDRITVVGDVSKGTAALYVVDLYSRIFKWEVIGVNEGIVQFSDPEVIPISPTGTYNSISPISNKSFYLTGGALALSRYNPEGTIRKIISTAIVSTYTTSLKYLGKQLNNEIVLVYEYGTGSIRGVSTLLKIPYGMVELAEVILRTNSLGTGDIVGTGDVEFIKNLNNSLDIYILNPYDGIAGYRITGFPINLPDYGDIDDSILGVDTYSLDFGEIYINDSSILSGVLRNTGSNVLNLSPSNITLEDNTGDFVLTNISDVSLGPQEDVTFSITFSPSFPIGEKTANININNPVGDNFNISIVGNSIDPNLYPPFTQDFNTLSSFPPTLWTKFSGLLEEQTTLTTTNAGWAYGKFGYIGTVNNAARLNVFGTINYWLVTPPIDLGDGTTDYELSFSVSLNAYNSSNPPNLNGTDDKFAIIISTDNGSTWSSNNTLRIYDNTGSPSVYNDISHTGETLVINLSGYSGVVKIGFYGESTVSNADNDIYIDNVTISAI